MHNNNIVLTILFTALLGLSKADFTEDLLKHHNELRAIHNSQPLALSTDLSKKAETIAREAALNGKFFKNNTGKEEPGVNTELICSSFKRTIEDAKQVTEAWYGEVCNKDFSFERPFTAPTFARMIRKDAKFLGVGKASNEDDKQPCTYIVAVYDPIGKKDTSSNILEKGNFQYSSFCKNNRKKRSLYYRFPARFVIDPVTGKTKSVTPLKPTNTHQWHTVATGDFSENAPFGLPSESRSNTAEEGTPQYSYVSQRNLVRHKHLHSHLHKMTSKGHRKSHVIKTDEDEANNEEEEGDKRDAAPVATASVTAEALEAHNILRRIHGSPAMALNDEMAQDAQKVAESNAATGELKHSSSKELKDYGENLAFNCDPTGQFASIRESVKDWYMEACPDKGQPAYDFENQPGPGLVSHFTQLVWGDSIELGCGSATGEIEGLKCIFFACRYKKKGNMDGQYDDNVKKGDFEVSETCPNIKGILHIGERATTGPENVPGTGLATGPSIGEVTGPGEIVLPVPTDGSSEIFRDEVTYQTDCLKVINRFRQIHLSPVLVADVLLHDEALKIAEALVDTEDTRNKMKEKLKSNKQGLFQISCSPDNKVLPPEESMANWYREVCFRLKDFDFTSKDNLKKAPHFTQLVWRSSKKVGIAYATKTKPKSKTLCTVVVAKFDPIGNGDDLVENVAQGSFDRSFCGSIHSMALNALVTPAVVKPEKLITPSGSVITDIIECNRKPTILPDGTKVTPEGEMFTASNAKITPCGGKVRPGGSEIKPDGNVVTVGGETVKPDGNIVTSGGKEVKPGELPTKPDGSRVTPGGSEVKPDGNVVTPEGETIKPGGVVVKPSGEVVKPVSETVKPEAETVKPDGSRVTSGGSEIKPDGNVITPEGETVKPDGTIVTSDGKETKPEELPTNPDGSRITPGGSEVKPNGEVVTPEGETIKPGGEVVKPDGSVVTVEGETVKKPEVESVKPDGSRVTSGESEIKPDGNVVTPEGETIKPDGNIVTSGGKEIKPEELPIKPDGSRVTPGGSEVKPDGNVVTPEGETIKPGGEVVKPSGEVVKPETVQPTGEAVKPDGSRVTSGGSEIKTDGSVVTPEGETIKPDGTAVKPSGEVVKPEEQEVKPDGSRVTPNGAEVKPDGSVVTSGGETVKPENEKVETGKPAAATGESEKPPEGGGVALNSFDAAGLTAHNKFRSIHGVPPLKLDTQLSRDCSEYAKVLANLGTLQHAQGDFGENLAYKCSSNLKEYAGDVPVIAWYNEVCKPGYQFGTENPSGAVLHFTQLVWKATTILGMGVAQSQKNGMTCYYAVARYKIRGNMANDYVENVPKGKFTEDMCKDLKKVLSDTADPSPPSVGGGEATTNKPDANAVTPSKGGGEEVKPDGTKTDKPQAPEGDGNGGGSVTKPDGTSVDIPEPSASKETPTKEESGPGNTFEEQALFAHNQFRKLHNAPAMTLDSTMSSEAAAYAQKLANMGTLQHASGLKYGENLAYECSSDTTPVTGDKPVFNWYAEVCDPGYTFSASSGFSSGTGHFTQVVWKESLKLGIGMATGKKGSMTCTYTVGRYSPRGNMGGKYVENVEKGGFDVSKCENEMAGIHDLLKAGKTVAGGGATTGGGATDGGGGATTGGGGGGEATTEEAGGGDLSGSFNQQALKAHNVLRQLHGVPVMTLDPEMSVSAMKWAKYMAGIKDIEHSKSGSADNPEKDGENIAYMCKMGDKPVYPGQEPVLAWYKEVCKPGYTFGSESMGGAGHFTQVTWKTSVKLGIGMAEGEKDGFKCFFTVARYREAGNYFGKFGENVVKGGYDKGTHCADGKLEEMLGLPAPKKNRHSVPMKHLTKKSKHRSTLPKHNSATKPTKRGSVFKYRAKARSLRHH